MKWERQTWGVYGEARPKWAYVTGHNGAARYYHRVMAARIAWRNGSPTGMTVETGCDRRIHRPRLSETVPPAVYPCRYCFTVIDRDGMKVPA